MRATTLIVWCILVVVVITLEAVGRRRVGGLAPLVEALRALRAPAVGQVCLVLAWMWLGWHVFAR